jgi:hypothetical protein
LRSADSLVERVYNPCPAFRAVSLISKALIMSKPEEPDDKARALELNAQPKNSVYSLRIEYAEDASGSYPPKLIHLLQNWHRDFKISGQGTLEQLSSAILQILGWDRNHLYEFRIGEQAYAYLGEDELFVDWDKCVSCDVPLYLLGLTPRNTFTYL